MARPLGPIAALAASLLAVSVAGAGGAGAAQRAIPKRGGTVVVAMNSLAEPACLGWAPICLQNPQWRDKVLARPFLVAPKGYRNDLVAGYRLTRDPFTVTFHIRPQARWSDGVSITAQDFVFAYRTYRAHSGYQKGDPFRTAIRRVRVVDAKTVRFVFGSRYGDWKALLDFPPLPEHALRGQNLAASAKLWRDGIVDPRTGAPIASGPFLVGPWERGRQLVLVRNPRYWGSHRAYVDRIVLRFVLGPDTEQALRSGKVDLGVLAETTPGELHAYSGFQPRTTLWGAWEHFEIRVGKGGHPALKDRRVRQALAYGINRAALAAIGERRPVLDSTIYLTNERPYRPNWARYRYRPAYARSLLDKAGCQVGSDGIYVCADEPLRLRFVTTAGGGLRQRVLELVGPQLRRVGVEVIPVYVPPAVLFGVDSPLEQGNFDVALFQYVKTAPGDVSSPYRCPPDSNVSGYCNRPVTAELARLDHAVDPARRTAIANRIDRLLSADVPALPLYQHPLTFVVRNGLHGVVPNGYTGLTSEWCVWNAENWWLDR